MYEIETMLGALRNEALPGALHNMDQAIFDGLNSRREQQVSRRGMALAVAVASFVGMAAGTVGSSPAAAEPLFATPSAAPSQLLAD